jgi:putative ABC transport system substrate-binding protein
MMNRRRFLLTSLAGVIGARRRCAAGREGMAYRMARDQPAHFAALRGLPPGIARPRLVEGQNVIIERRYSESREDRHTAFVAEFIQMKVDLIVASSSAAAHAAKQATDTIPIVMLAMPSPERLGLVVSLARPGGNVTGMSNQFGEELSGKMFQLLKETVPKLSKVAIPWNPGNLGSADTGCPDPGGAQRLLRRPPKVPDLRPNRHRAREREGTVEPCRR